MSGKPIQLGFQQQTLCSINHCPNGSSIQAPIATDNYRSVDGGKSHIRFSVPIFHSSILHEFCLSNNSLSEALNSSKDKFLPNLCECSNDFLEAQISQLSKLHKLKPLILTMFKHPTTCKYFKRSLV